MMMFLLSLLCVSTYATHMEVLARRTLEFDPCNVDENVLGSSLLTLSETSGFVQDNLHLLFNIPDAFTVNFLRFKDASSVCGGFDKDNIPICPDEDYWTVATNAVGCTVDYTSSFPFTAVYNEIQGVNLLGFSLEQTDTTAELRSTLEAEFTQLIDFRGETIVRTLEYSMPWSLELATTLNLEASFNVQHAPSSSPSLNPTTSLPTSSPSTSVPTISPSVSPSTSRPTLSPTFGPITSTPSLSPSNSPVTSSPSKMPLTSEPTNFPTISPSTSTPTQIPSSSPITSSPSMSPSENPTTSTPTLAPSLSPVTSEPSQRPSNEPTFSAPSSTPTTSTPTVSPTKFPTSSQPSANPVTSVPSLSPVTSEPSLSPTLFPTTTTPSLNPVTTQPSANPVTSVPSLSPTAVPSTSMPSKSPSTSTPTKVPSLSPVTSLPTISPSLAPSSSLPTKSPSLTPTSSVPTLSPSSNPSTSPITTSPSIIPTTSPSTSEPTLSPTVTPTKVPTTTNPTSFPSTTPTFSNPTLTPTLAPSSSVPTISPTQNPTTSVPTLNPSKVPTNGPTVSPVTSQPSLNPSSSPVTSQPSQNPVTSQPSASPSLFPTTAMPTVNPSTSPSVVPTTSPSTSMPSLSPTFNPTTSIPSVSPSQAPTTSNPTKTPSLTPTTSTPSISPSFAPTFSAPSVSPTLFPTTSMPSTAPSKFPTTTNPTKFPTYSAPTNSPSVSPTTSLPTVSPTLFPSNMPTVSPTHQPTTSRPTDFPSTEPTMFPTSLLSFKTCDHEGEICFDGYTCSTNDVCDSQLRCIGEVPEVTFTDQILTDFAIQTTDVASAQSSLSVGGRSYLNFPYKLTDSSIQVSAEGISTFSANITINQDCVLADCGECYQHWEIDFIVDKLCDVESDFTITFQAENMITSSAAEVSLEMKLVQSGVCGTVIQDAPLEYETKFMDSASYDDPLPVALRNVGEMVYFQVEVLTAVDIQSMNTVKFSILMDGIEKVVSGPGADNGMAADISFQSSNLFNVMQSEFLLHNDHFQPDASGMEIQLVQTVEITYADGRRRMLNAEGQVASDFDLSSRLIVTPFTCTAPYSVDGVDPGSFLQVGCSNGQPGVKFVYCDSNGWNEDKSYDTCSGDAETTLPAGLPTVMVNTDHPENAAGTSGNEDSTAGTLIMSAVGIVAALLVLCGVQYYRKVVDEDLLVKVNDQKLGKMSEFRVAKRSPSGIIETLKNEQEKRHSAIFSQNHLHPEGEEPTTPTPTSFGVKNRLSALRPHTKSQISDDGSFGGFSFASLSSLPMNETIDVEIDGSLMKIDKRLIMHSNGIKETRLSIYE